MVECHLHKSDQSWSSSLVCRLEMLWMLWKCRWNIRTNDCKPSQSNVEAEGAYGKRKLLVKWSSWPCSVGLRNMLKVYYYEPHEEQEYPEWGCEPAQWLHQDWQEEVHLRYPHFSVDKSQINSPEQLSTVLKWNIFGGLNIFKHLHVPGQWLRCTWLKPLCEDRKKHIQQNRSASDLKIKAVVWAALSRGETMYMSWTVSVG